MYDHFPWTAFLAHLCWIVFAARLLRRDSTSRKGGRHRPPRDRNRFQGPSAFAVACPCLRPSTPKAAP